MCVPSRAAPAHARSSKAGRIRARQRRRRHASSSRASRGSRSSSQSRARAASRRGRSATARRTDAQSPQPRGPSTAARRKGHSEPGRRSARVRWPTALPAVTRHSRPLQMSSGNSSRSSPFQLTTLFAGPLGRHRARRPTDLGRPHRGAARGTVRRTLAHARAGYLMPHITTGSEPLPKPQLLSQTPVGLTGAMATIPAGACRSVKTLWMTGTRLTTVPPASTRSTAAISLLAIPARRPLPARTVATRRPARRRFTGA